MSKRNTILGFHRVNNKVHRNAFDLSRRHMFTAQIGELLPVSYQWTLPNETYRLGYDGKTRTASLNTDAFTRLQENIQYYFVPFQALWRYFEVNSLNMTKGDAGQNISKVASSSTEEKPITTKMPYVNYKYLASMLQNIYDYSLNAVDAYFKKFTSPSQRSAQGFYTFCSDPSQPSWASYRNVFRHCGYRLCRAAKLLMALGYGNFSTAVQYDIYAMADKFVQDGNAWDKNKFASNTTYCLNLGNDTWSHILNAPNLSVFPLLAYHKICQDHYKNKKWQSFDPRNCNIDYLDANSNLDASSWYSMSMLHSDDVSLLDLEQSNLPLDYITGVLPTAQYGDEAAATLDGSLGSLSFKDISTNDNSSWRSGGRINPPAIATGNLNVPSSSSHVQVGSNSSANLFTFSNGEFKHAHVVTAASLQSAVHLNPSTAALKISALRSATALQKYKEIQNSNDPDFADQVLAHFGVKPHTDKRESRFIGGGDSTLQINPIVNNNLSGDNETTIKAIGQGSLSARCKFTSDTYGIIIGIYRAVPQLDYANIGIDRNLFKTDSSDFPLPEFENIGMQTQYRNEIVAPRIGVNYTLGDYPITDTVGKIDMAETYGYAARYAELKVSRDTFEGGFCGTYKTWVSGYDDAFLNYFSRHEAVTSKLLAISYLFPVRPSMLYNIFVSQWSGTVNDDKLLIGSVNTCQAVRPFSVHGLPYCN